MTYPVSTNLASAVLETAARLDGAGVMWVLGGSSGLALRGFALPSPPRDVDVYIDMQDSAAAHDALSAFAVDLPMFSETDIYRSVLSHYAIGGVQVELVAGFVVNALGCEYRTEVRDVLMPHTARVPLGGRLLPLTPLAHELWFNALRGRADRVSLVASAMRGRPADHIAALAAIESRGRFAPAVLGALHARLAEAGIGKEGSRDER